MHGDSGMELYRLVASEEGPKRLFVGGLHGDEGKYTAPILERLAKENLNAGEATIVPSLVENGKYIGVLSEAYYRSKAGMDLLQLIHDYKPTYYFELHAYGEHSYAKLTDCERVNKIGVPNFVDFGDGVLIGSIAPILRRKFAVHDFCITIEVPKWRSENEQIKEKVHEILMIGLMQTNRDGIMREFRLRYPAQTKLAETLFYQYYHNLLNPF
uniref:DUF2119 domain-containing protein n=1 Tax=Candidatus Methanophaga sp. ANME-1 ERB7 TaxID=2759913 RepID=A0A7G9Z2Z6_9EURY|nr:hypothetical protein GNACHGJL_00012 [Methanosarcinales archaeon ANME-1 ERB7]